MKPDTRNRNSNLDAFKAIAAISVIFIHYNHVEGDIGEIYTRILFNITKFAVPFFFMITGFFLIPIVEKHREKAYLKKILIIALCSSAFYCGFYLVDAANHLGWLREHYTFGRVFTWLTGQDDPAGFHLWYLYCLLWTFAITVFIYKYSNFAVLYLVTLILVAYHFYGVGMFQCYTISLPAMVLGMVLYRNRSRISRLSPKIVAICAIGMFAIMGLEAYYDISEPGFYYEGHALAFIFFIIALSASVGFGSSRLAYIGLEFSALIYILHVFANNILSRFIVYDSIMLQVLRPWMVFGFSLGLAMICVYISSLKIKYEAYKN